MQGAFRHNLPPPNTSTEEEDKEGFVAPMLFLMIVVMTVCNIRIRLVMVSLVTSM